MFNYKGMYGNNGKGLDMNNMIRILAFAGSTRSGSFNKQLIRLGAESVRQAGAEVTFVDLSDYPMPLYDGDLELKEGMPEKALDLKKLAAGHDGFFISTPEYNNSITGVLKNTIDWMSRVADKGDPGDVFKGKAAALMSASPGPWGGIRALPHVRAVLNALDVIVLPDFLSVTRAAGAFDEDGRLKDDSIRKRVDALALTLVDTTKRLHV